MNFISYIIANGLVSEWREFNISELFNSLTDENVRTIKGDTKVAIAESNWNDEKHRIVKLTEDYLKGFALAAIVRVDNRGNIMRFTELGKEMLLLGSIEVFLQKESERKEKEKNRQKWKDTKDKFDSTYGRITVLVLFAITVFTFVVNSFKSCHCESNTTNSKPDNNKSAKYSGKDSVP